LNFGHSPLTPLPKIQNRKRNFKILKTIPTVVGKKKRNTSANTAYLEKVFTKLFRKLLRNFRYADTLAEIYVFLLRLRPNSKKEALAMLQEALELYFEDTRFRKRQK